jgi:hypothetical protein
VKDVFFRKDAKNDEDVMYNEDIIGAQYNCLMYGENSFI